MAREVPFQLSIGSVISQTFAVYLRNLIPFLVLGTVAYSPLIALEFLTRDSAPEDALPIRILTIVLMMLLPQVLTGTLVHGVLQQLLGKPAPLGDTIAQGFRSLFRVLGTGLLVGLLVGVASIALIIPGAYLAVRWYVAVPVAVIEGKSGTAAMARSRDLVKGCGWQVFWMLVLVGLVNWLIIAAVGAIVVIVQGADVQMAVNSPWLSSPITVVTSTFGATLMAVLYFRLRQGRENVDVQQIAAVFG